MADISLLFGVAGGGSVSRGSGELIALQLSSIVNNINNNPLEIKFKADAESLSAISKQLSDITKSVRGAGGIDLGVSGVGETAKSIDKLGDSLDSISADLKAVREVIASIGASLPQSGSAMEKMLRSGSIGVEDLVSKLTELRDIINQINSKELNITNTFSYTKQAQTGADELELYREKAYETLDVVRKLDSELVRAQKLGGSVTSSAIAKTGDANGFLQSVNDYLSMTSSGRKANITKAKSVGELQSIIKQNEEFARSYTKVLTAVNEDGFAISFPDMSGVDSASRAIEAYKSKAQELENTFVEATKSASELNNTQKNLYEGMSVDGAEGGISETIRKEFGEIDTELTGLREKIESVFDFTTLTIDTSKIKSALDEVKQEFDSLTKVALDASSTSANTTSGSGSRKRATRKSSTKRVAGEESSSKEVDDLLRQSANFIRSANDAQKSWTGITDEDRSSLDRTTESAGELRAQLRDGAIDTETFREKFATLNRELAEFKERASFYDGNQDVIKAQEDQAWKEYEAQKNEVTKELANKKAAEAKEEAAIEAATRKEIDAYRKAEEAAEAKAQKQIESETRAAYKTKEIRAKLMADEAADIARETERKKAQEAREDAAAEKAAKREIVAYRKEERLLLNNADKLSSDITNMSLVGDGVISSENKRSLEEYSAQLDSLISKYRNGAIGTEEFRRELDDITDSYARLKREIKTDSVITKLVDAETKREASLLDNADRLSDNIELSLLSDQNASPANKADLESYAKELSELVNEYKNGSVAVDDFSIRLDNLDKKYSKYKSNVKIDNALAKSAKSEALSIEKEAAAQERALKAADKLFSDMNVSFYKGKSVSAEDKSELDSYISRIRDLRKEYDKGSISLEEFSHGLKEVGDGYTQYKNRVSVENSAIERDSRISREQAQEEAEINNLINRRLSLIKQVQDLQRSIVKSGAKDSDILGTGVAADIRAKGVSETLASLDAENLDVTNIKEWSQALNAVEIELKQVSAELSAFELAASQVDRSSLNITDNADDQRKAIERLRNLYDEASKSVKNFSAARTGISRDEYAKLAETIPKIDSLMESLRNSKITVGEFESKYNDLYDTIRNSTDVIKKNGEAHKATGESLRGLAQKFSTWFGITQIISAVYRSMRMMVNEVVELDSAMTELKKVTDETEASYELFLNNAAKRSRELGASLSDTVNATADFARLGYSIEDAEAMADAAIVYKTVGDGIEDINEASESIIATMQAFGSETLSAMGIVDKFNNVGRIFADLCSNAQKVKVAISVKDQRWPRPSKDSVILRMRRDCNTSIGNNRGFATPLFKRVKIQSELTL